VESHPQGPAFKAAILQQQPKHKSERLRGEESWKKGDRERYREEEKRGGKEKEEGLFPLAQTRPERDIQRRERELELERERVGARREKPKEEGECSPAQPEQERGGKKEREGRTVVAGSPEMGDGCVSGDVAVDRSSVGVCRPPLW
jgi:hypothetical protein